MYPGSTSMYPLAARRPSRSRASCRACWPSARRSPPGTADPSSCAVEGSGIGDSRGGVRASHQHPSRGALLLGPSGSPEQATNWSSGPQWRARRFLTRLPDTKRQRRGLTSGLIAPSPSRDSGRHRCHERRRSSSFAWPRIPSPYKRSRAAESYLHTHGHRV